MAAPLAPDFAESVLWQEQAPAPTEPGAEPQRPAARRDLPDRARRDRGRGGLRGGVRGPGAGGRRPRRLVLDADAGAVGGASTRNGGMVIPELKAGPAALERALGPLGRRLYAEVNEAFDHVEALTAGPAPLIACDYERSGQLYLAHAARLVPAPAGHGPGARRAGRAGAVRPPRPSWATRSDRRPTTAASSSSAQAGSTPPGSTAASWPGPGTPVPGSSAAHVRARSATGPARGGGASRVGRPATAPPTSGGRRGRRVHERLRRRAMPELAAAGTAGRQLHHRHRGAGPRAGPLGRPRGRMFVDSKNFLFYWRLTPDGRVVFGGRRSLARSTLAQARDFLYDSMVAVHPQLAGVRGRPGVGRRRGRHARPAAARRAGCDGAWYATGCNGGGVAAQHVDGHDARAAPGRRRSAPGVRRAPAPGHPPAPLAPSCTSPPSACVPLAGPRLPSLTRVTLHPRAVRGNGSHAPSLRPWVPHSEPAPDPRPSGTLSLTGRGTRPAA